MTVSQHDDGINNIKISKNKNKLNPINTKRKSSGNTSAVEVTPSMHSFIPPV